MKFGKGSAEVSVNTASRDVLFREITARLQNRSGFTLATLNLDHLTKLRHDPAFAAAYRAHDLIVADGRPVGWLAQLGGQPVEVLPGADLVVPLCALAAQLDVPVALIGSSDAALKGAAETLKRAAPGLRIAFRHAPPYGFDPQSDAAAVLLNDLAGSGAGLCFIALGAPKQEIFAAGGRRLVPAVGFASIGAGLDFLAGQQVRAPHWMRVLALEWMWRTAQDPRRMVPRYARCFAILPGLALAAWQQRRSRA